METLQEAEITLGRMLTRSDVLKIVAQRMKEYDIPMKFTPGRRR